MEAGRGGVNRYVPLLLITLQQRTGRFTKRVQAWYISATAVVPLSLRWGILQAPHSSADTENHNTWRLRTRRNTAALMEIKSAIMLSEINPRSIVDRPAQVVVPPVVLGAEVELDHLCLELLKAFLPLASTDQLTFVDAHKQRKKRGQQNETKITTRRQPPKPIYLVQGESQNHLHGIKTNITSRNPCPPRAP